MEGVTRESIRPLLDLQRIDSSVDRLAQRRANLPEQRDLNEQTDTRAEAGGGYAEKEAELGAVVREQTKRETEVNQIDEKIAHENSRLYSGEVSSPKELSNIQAELDALRRRKAHLEDEELDVMEQREGLEKEASELKARLEELDAKVADATARRDHASIEIEQELADLSKQRAEVVPSLNASVVELYEDIRARRGGVAVAALENGVCRACGLPLSPMARDEIKRSNEAIVHCENCRRLLVVL